MGVMIVETVGSTTMKKTFRIRIHGTPCVVEKRELNGETFYFIRAVDNSFEKIIPITTTGRQILEHAQEASP